MLVSPASLPVSQRFAGAAESEDPGYFVNASDGRALKGYGEKFPNSIYHHDFHKGIDIYGAIGTPLVAIEDGTVIFAGNDGAGGKWIKVMFAGHTDARYSYDHCDKFLVGVGAKVTKGQRIATVGKTGRADGPHNHFMIEFKEKGSDGKVRWIAYDPARFYPSHTFRYGLTYRAAAITHGWSDKDGYLYGGSHVYDDGIFPVRAVTINDGTNVRKLPDKTSDPLLLTKTVIPATQINEVPGGEYTINGVTAKAWAKVRLVIDNAALMTGYVAKPLIKIV